MSIVGGMDELGNSLRSTSLDPSDASTLGNHPPTNNTHHTTVHVGGSNIPGVIYTAQTSNTSTFSEPPPTSSFDFASTYRPNATIVVHRKPYKPEWSDSGNESDNENSLPDSLDDSSHPSPHSKVIGDYVNVCHQNWLALRQEWKKRPLGWAPKRRLNLDSQTICDRITSSGVLSDRPDEGVPLPEVVRVMVQVWEREGVNLKKNDFFC